MHADGFVMPAVEIGLPVLWYPHGDRNQRPHAAVVTAAGERSVNVNLLEPESYTMPLRDGVRHVSDPNITKSDARESGGWDYCPWYKRLLRTESALGDLMDTPKPAAAATAKKSA